MGGGTAGWMTAAYLARMLATSTPGGARITVVESEDFGIIGVGEGTFPSIRKTLGRIGLAEADLIRSANATFKQGIAFVNWRSTGSAGPDRYFHPFQIADQGSGLDLLPYWLAGAASGQDWASASNVQMRVADAYRAPKLITHPEYAGPLNYAYHFDAVAFAGLLRSRAIEQGVTHVFDTIDNVTMAPTGEIESLVGRKTGRLTADLYVDCTGFRAQLIGQAMGVPFKSFKSQLFTNRAVAIQVPYDDPAAPIPSYTKAVAQTNGWIWDIGLQERRGTGYVYSSDHTSDEAAEACLRTYIGHAADDLPSRILKFEAGYREVQWKKNCVAVGLSAGFIEPLEATGIGFAEIAGVILAALFPWSDQCDSGAEQFNAQMRERYAHVIDFIKLHYCVSNRRDTDFWLDNINPGSISDGLRDRLEQWKYRAPSFIDVDLKHDIFTEHNWQYVLYGMGYKTILGDRIAALRYFDEARAEFQEIQKQAEYALTIMPEHRSLVELVRRQGFTPKRAA
ncbi:tryptophan halogenase family protein [Asticcacaulis benevestitus]|uniref:tryptophan halogenase family protein n=1 Tax=Asticcacaulis benevestitus TaxID=347481 RepID=UPI00039D7A32|nr:tryptophan halogenase family protein [Asticcacaulis benevestitus]